MRSSLRILRLIVLAAFIGALAACGGAPEPPPSCAPGHTLMGAPPPEGQEVWCQKSVNGKDVKDGLFIVYNTGGSKMLQGTYRDGVQEGEWTIWYENGQRASIDHYTNGIQDGLHTSWYANGTMSLSGEYHNGKREGVWTSWDPGGLSSRHQLYKDGQLTSERPAEGMGGASKSQSN
jgi:MORN repeat variant